MSKISVFIVDDHAVVREGARQTLGAQPDIEVIGVAEDSGEALGLLETLRPDTAIIDISMPGLSGLDLIRSIPRLSPATKMVMLSVHQSPAFIREALAAGALGYVLKTAPITDLIEAVRAVARGEYYLSARIRAEVVAGYAKAKGSDASDSGYDALSEREQQVFRLVVQGKTNKQIGDLLNLSSRTVEKHRSSILHKLNIRDTVEMVRYAVKLGIVDPAN